MGSTWHYDDNPLPVGRPVNANGQDTWYGLGLYDGSDHGEQYADEPESEVLFQSPVAATEWLQAVTEVLGPYIDSADRSARVPAADGWAEDEA